MNKIEVAKVLSVAGSDPSGGAGIQGDIKTIHNHGAYAMAVISALTAQNTKSVYKVIPVCIDMFESQLNAIYEDIRPDSVKIGMIYSKDTAESLALKLSNEQQKNIVYDPVLVSSSGVLLSSKESIEEIKSSLMPQVDLLTPNLSEAEFLSEMSIDNDYETELAAEKISRMVRGGVLIKGGHTKADLSEQNRDESYARDYLFYRGKGLWIEAPRIKSRNTHGTGCCLSSAIATNLAKGLSMEDSVKLAKKYMNLVLSQELAIGEGQWSVNHLAPQNI